MQAQTVDPGAVTCEWYNVPCTVNAAIDWTYEALEAVPRVIYGGIADAAAFSIEAIPVPEFITNIGSQAASVGAVQGAGYFLGLAAFGPGLAILFTALVIRFTIRRLPVIG